MPQLDTVSYISQITFLIVFFVGFYFFVVHFALPKVAVFLKVRKWILAGGKGGASELQNEQDNVKNEVGQMVASLSKVESQSYVSTLGLGQNWIEDSANLVNKSSKIKGAGINSFVYSGSLKGRVNVVNSILSSSVGYDVEGHNYNNNHNK